MFSFYINSMLNTNPSRDAHAVSSDTPLIVTELKVFYINIIFIKSLFRPQMTHLSISSGSIPIREWVNMLSGLPALLELEIVFASYTSDAKMAETRAAPTSPQRPVTLPRLQYIYLSGDNAGMVTDPLLRHLAFPSTTALRYKDYWFQPRNAEEAPIIFQVILSAIRRCTDNRDRVFKFVRMYRHDPAEGHRLAMDAWPTVRTIADLNNDFSVSRRQGSLSVMFCSLPSLIPSIPQPFVSTFPLSDVEAPAIIGLGDMSFWSHLARLRCVTDLSVAFLRPTLSFIQTFASPVRPDDDPEREPTALFPGLQSLTVTAAAQGDDDDSNNGRTLAKHLRTPFCSGTARTSLCVSPACCGASTACCATNWRSSRRRGAQMRRSGTIRRRIQLM